MKRSGFLYCFICFFAYSLVACHPVVSQIVETQKIVATPTRTFDVTSTPAPSHTARLLTTVPPTPRLTLTKPNTPSPRPSQVTASQTPLPTIGTTFDLHAIKTATMAPSAVCPAVKGKPTEIPKIENNFDADQEVIGFLNQYGAGPLLTDRTQKLNAEYQDLTNDGVPELALGLRKFLVYGCKKGSYTLLLDLDPNRCDRAPEVVAVLDTNRNGIPELYMLIEEGSLGTGYYQIYEWNGGKFSELIFGLIEVSGNGRLSFEDENQDGMQEVVANHEIPYDTNIWYQGLPLRNGKSYYQWDGLYFQYYKKEFAVPEYRFQAVQDGDRASLQGEYERALDFYQQAIFSDQLDWWSQEKWASIRDASAGFSTPTLISPDSTEYDHLAAYSRFRIMLLHLSRGYQSDAKVVYDTLQAKYPLGKPGHSYAEMANIFWREYEVSSNLTDSCAQVIAYAHENVEDIVTYIGDTDYHGDQTIHYRNNLEMLCPFR